MLARCERVAELTEKGFAMSDRTAMLGYLDMADKILKAMSGRQLSADLAVLNKGLTAAPQGLGGAYGNALAQLEADNPQPTAEHLARAEATVAAYGPDRRHFTNPSSTGRTFTRDAPKINRAAPSAAPDMLYKRSGGSA